MARRIVDLTFAIHEGMTTFPVHWHLPVEVTQLGRHGLENRETRKLTLGTHTGTHCDAPRHFIPGGATVDELPLDVLVGRARVLDFSDQPERTQVTAAEIESRLGSERPTRVINRFDWSKHWGTRKYYPDHPFLSKDAAQLLVDRGVKLLAMDTPMPDNPDDHAYSAEDSPIHKILLGAGVVLVEYLTNLSQLTQDHVELVALPLKIVDGDGSPVRCIAIEEQG